MLGLAPLGILISPNLYQALLGQQCCHHRELVWSMRLVDPEQRLSTDLWEL